ncbi:TWiK family of potassium channels protein 18-like [Limulus polyphemus]|uniref:TWiK family of potassium channels protein 18-like n=1 Tax=Limulus polyphemus TaxID=6850 RepID=A0ABM1B456_LIMPO|nr:TWiK family of potassium channels protein 18-like [Limulus polyphemus]
MPELPTVPSNHRLYQCDRCKRFLRSFTAHLFSHIGLCGLVIGYAIVGAFTFESLEATHEITKRSQISKFRENCLEDLWEITNNLNVLYQENWTVAVAGRLKDFEQTVVNAVKNEGYIGKDTTDVELQWSFPGALLYSITVITTIGYGNIAPKTDIGKVVTIFYALFGIPLMLLCLTNIGDLLARSFKFGYSRLCCALCRQKRLSQDQVTKKGVSMSQAKPVEDKTVQRMKEEKCPVSTIDVVVDATRVALEQDNNEPDGSPKYEVTEEDMFQDDAQMRHQTILRPTHSTSLTNKVITSAQDHQSPNNIVTKEQAFRDNKNIVEERVPIYLVLLLVTGYICGGAILFSLWENWSFLNGAYFCFITLSTIGFGDLVPGTDIFDTREQAKLIICCFYLIIGLAIIAMSFNLVQEEAVIKCKTIARNLGILSADNDSN